MKNASTMLLTRNSMLETLREDFVIAARAKGLPEKVVRDKHAARNAMLPVVTSLVYSLVFAIDGSVISLCKQLEKLFASVHPGKSSLKLNVKYSLKLEAVTKLQVSTGRRHDSRFSFVTQAAQQLYLADLGYWSFKLMKRIIEAGSFFVMRL